MYDISLHICDTIKGNESHVSNIQFWVFNINHLSIENATFWSKPHLNRTSGCGDMNILWNLKTMKNIRICHLYKPVTQNQYSRHPTHSPWSCHIYASAQSLYCSSLTTLRLIILCIAASDSEIEIREALRPIVLKIWWGPTKCKGRLRAHSLNNLHVWQTCLWTGVFSR